MSYVFLCVFKCVQYKNIWEDQNVQIKLALFLVMYIATL